MDKGSFPRSGSSVGNSGTGVQWSVRSMNFSLTDPSPRTTLGHYQGQTVPDIIVSGSLGHKPSTVRRFSDGSSGCWISRCELKQSCFTHTNIITLTSSNGQPPLQDADVQLQGQLGCWSQEGLNDRGASEGRSVCEQLPLRLPHLPLHLLRLTPMRYLLLPGDADIRLLYTAHAAIDAERLQTPAAQKWWGKGRVTMGCR